MFVVSVHFIAGEVSLSHPPQLVTTITFDCNLSRKGWGVNAFVEQIPSSFLEVILAELVWGTCGKACTEGMSTLTGDWHCCDWYRRVNLAGLVKKPETLTKSWTHRKEEIILGEDACQDFVTFPRFVTPEWRRLSLRNSFAEPVFLTLLLCCPQKSLSRISEALQNQWSSRGACVSDWGSSGGLRHWFSGSRVAGFVVPNPKKGVRQEVWVSECTLKTLLETD